VAIGRYASRAPLFKWLDDVLNPKSSSVRVNFPDSHAGPDIVMTLRNAEHTKVALVLVQMLSG